MEVVGEEREGTEPSVQVASGDLGETAALDQISPEHLREYRLQQEREWYTSIEGFLDFVRDCGAAPDAQEEPHGRGAHEILNWNSRPDPEADGRVIYTYKMQLWPRGSFKSAVFDVGLVCWEIARNPNIRICVCSETGKQARKFVAQAMQIIDSQWFRERFGVHRGKEWKEGSGSFVSALRTTKHKKESTLQSAGAGEVWTGSHWDLVVMDDVVSQENTRTPEAIENMAFWFGEILAQLDPGCRLLMIGTLHHFADLYCRIRKDPEMKKMFEFSIHAWKNPDGSLFFPGRITSAFIDQQKVLMPPRLFACFYLNQPTTEDDQIFKREYFRVIEDSDIPTSVWTYIFTDFAFIAEERRKGRADRTALWVVSLDCNRTAYVQDFYVGRWKPSDSVQIVCDLWNAHQRLNLKGVVIEDTTHKELLTSLFEEVRRRTFVRPKIITIPGRTQEVKDTRIEGVEPRFRAGNIYFSRRVRENRRKWGPLIAEMTEWPYSKHDDIPDAISDIDKRDKDDSYYLCPAPPPGWRSAGAVISKPNMIDGMYNPDRGYPAREFTKANQHSVGSGDLWQNAETGSSANQDIFRRRMNPLRQLGES
jgi:predicted phage terminase large subunit-like protein